MQEVHHLLWREQGSRGGTRRVFEECPDIQEHISRAGAAGRGHSLHLLNCCYHGQALRPQLQKWW